MKPTNLEALQPSRRLFRSKDADYGAAWWIAVCVVSLIGALAIAHGAAL